MADTHNDFTGHATGPVIQAGRIDTVNMHAAPPVALTGLPPLDAEFTGRVTDLAAVAEAMQTSPVIVVTGLAGVGKTTLAVKAAQSFRQILFVNLAEPEAALATFLRSLGIPAEHIPAEQPARELLYRSTLATHTEPLLILLDNAISTEQVRPLLPGTPHHRVLITSRHTLGDLNCRRIKLDVLSERDAIDLIRIDDRDAARELVGLCGYLPLALSIVGAILGDDPEQPVSVLLENLRNAGTRLDELSYGANRAVRAAFDLSYARLSPNEAKLFRLLALNPGPQVSIEAAAWLTELPLRQTRRLVDALRRANLLLPGTLRGWVRFHDLLRLYATDQASQSEEERDSAIIRLIDYYLETAASATNQLLPKAMQSIGLARFTTRRDALHWLDTEHPCLVGVVTLAYETGRHQDTRDLALSLSDYFDLRKHWDDWILIHQAALLASKALGDRKNECRALVNLGNVQRQNRRYDSAISYYEQALATGDHTGKGIALNGIGMVHLRMGRFDASLDAHGRALAIRRAAGDQRGVAITHNSLGTVHRQLDNLTTALDHHREALRLLHEVGDPHGEGLTLNNIGNVYRQMGDLDAAAEHLLRALESHRDNDDRYAEAQTLFNLGLATEEPVRRRSYWEQSHLAFQQAGDDYQAQVVHHQISQLPIRRENGGDGPL